jgi:FKBP12-rapamycin complex-associated protein
MSMVGYILGLGDRHPSNLMMSRKTGKIIHIDFGDCFEIAMKRDKFPEKVPFRLTRMLVKALEVSGVEGTFRIICEQVMKLMRDNKDSLLAILGSFLYDPLISFRLMIPMIIKQKKFQSKNQKPKKKESNFFNYRNSNKKSSKFLNNLSSSVKDKNCIILKFDDLLDGEKKTNKVNKDNKNIINDNHDNNNYNINSPKKHKEEEKEEKIEEIDEEKEKNEKKRMENDERHIFNIYQENDEIESEELNKIAKIVLERISNKLSGTEFYPEIVYNVKEQVDKLINEAMSYENLAQSYLGWCPFW